MTDQKDKFKSKYDGDFKRLSDVSFFKFIAIVFAALVYLILFLKIVFIP